MHDPAHLNETPITAIDVGKMPVADLLAEHLATLGPGHDLVEIRSGIEAYLASAQQATVMLEQAASETESPAGLEVTQYLRSYLAAADDLIPDHHGAYGILDDAWLILNTAFRLIESGALTIDQVPLDWSEIVAVDPVVRHLMPAGVLPILEDQLLHLLDVIAAEIAAYRPWMSPGGGGGRGQSPTIPSGGALEEKMAAALRGTGFSF